MAARLDVSGTPGAPTVLGSDGDDRPAGGGTHGPGSGDVGRGDWSVVDALHRDLPRDDRYLRFFTMSRTGARAVADVIVAADAVAVGAFRGDRLLGVAHFRPDPGGADPEVAIAVAHAEQHHGVASLLLEHLVSAARAEGVQRLTADVLAINHDMLRVIRDSGLPFSSQPEGDVLNLVLHLPPATGSGPRTTSRPC